MTGAGRVLSLLHHLLYLDPLRTTALWLHNRAELLARRVLRDPGQDSILHLFNIQLGTLSLLSRAVPFDQVQFGSLRPYSYRGASIISLP